MEFKPCSARINLVAFRADGGKDKVYRCSEPTSPHPNQDVTPEDCDSCPVRVAVLEAAVAGRTFVRSPLAVYPKKVDANASEGFLACLDRVKVQRPACCGQFTEHRLCNSMQSPLFGEEVTPVMCSQCPVRRIDAPL